jgi:hypothetical protein
MQRMKAQDLAAGRKHFRRSAIIIDQMPCFPGRPNCD